MPPPTTSVIIPAYQAAPYLDAALGSVAAQTHPADEVVVIDDASVDETGMIAERWARVLPINLIRKSTNEGLGAARATGIAASSGELVALLDSDDVLFPDHLDVLLDQYQRRPGIVTSGYFRWWPGRAVDTKPSYVLNSVPPPDGQRLEILRRNFINVTALFSREDYERAGGFSARRKDEDWDLWIRMIRNGVEVSHPSTVGWPGSDGDSGYWFPTPVWVRLLGSVEGCFVGGRDVVAVSREGRCSLNQWTQLRVASSSSSTSSHTAWGVGSRRRSSVL
jgi:glycosyltransferase involved in cell wall biosynthesis